jgi:hypothetical protein
MEAFQFAPHYCKIYSFLMSHSERGDDDGARKKGSCIDLHLLRFVLCVFCFRESERHLQKDLFLQQTGFTSSLFLIILKVIDVCRDCCY